MGTNAASTASTVQTDNLTAPEAFILTGDCVELLKELEDSSVDAVVTDPPYELGFMGKKWDASGIAYRVDLWREVLRVLKPGGHLLAFGGTRTYHRMACAIEDAGFEIRDSIHWMYGSGFPKSLDVSKAIDKRGGSPHLTREGRPVGQRAPSVDTFRTIVEAWPELAPLARVVAEVERDVIGKGESGRTAIWNASGGMGDFNITAPATDAAKQWEGWGTALKPAHEPIVMARKPLDGTVAENVLTHGTGGINVDGCRIGRAADDTSGWSKTGSKASDNRAMSGANYARDPKPDAAGRWPANVLLDESAAEELDRQSGTTTSGAMKRTVAGYEGESVTGLLRGSSGPHNQHGDSGGASRFFYVAKASRKEREAGCENLPARSGAQAVDRDEGTAGLNNPRAGAGRTAGQVHNHHPTVKPIELMRYLVRMVTPPGGVVLDPFAGSGSTGCAAVQEGVDFIGLEREPEYVAIANARIAHWRNK